MRGDLKRIRELEWEVWKIEKKIRDEKIKYRMVKLRNELIDMIEEHEEELKQKMISKEREEKIDKRGLKVIRRNLGKNVIGKI